MTLEEIGQKLKSARDMSGLSLAQIQEKTKIPYNHLSSIDVGNFDDLPEPVYVSGFIRRYAECVGLDAQELVDEYRNELDLASGQTKKSGLLFKNQKNNGNNMPAQANYYNRQRIEKSAPNLFKLVPFYALWIVLILVLIIYLVNRQGEIEQNQQDASLLTLKQSASTILPAKSPGVSTLDEAVNQTADNTIVDPKNAAIKDGFKVTLKSKNHVWVEVKAVSNGESLFNGFVESGEKHDFSDKEGLRITAINGSIAVSASGKTTEYGVPGKTVEKIFSSDKVSQVAESQTNDGPASAVITKTTTATSSASVQNPASNKKPASETTVAKKPAALPPALKPRPIRENLPIHEATAPATEQNVQTPNNKAIDVPYRYSE